MHGRFKGDFDESIILKIIQRTRFCFMNGLISGTLAPLITRAGSEKGVNFLRWSIHKKHRLEFECLTCKLPAITPPMGIFSPDHLKGKSCGVSSWAEVTTAAGTGVICVNVCRFICFMGSTSINTPRSYHLRTKNNTCHAVNESVS